MRERRFPSMVEVKCFKVTGGAVRRPVDQNVHLVSLRGNVVDQKHLLGTVEVRLLGTDEHFIVTVGDFVGVVLRDDVGHELVVRWGDKHGKES